MSAWTYRLQDGKAAQEIVSAPSSKPMMEGPCADSEEKHEPASDIDTVLVDSLKVLDPNRPIREADIELADHQALFCASFKRTSRIRATLSQCTLCDLG